MAGWVAGWVAGWFLTENIATLWLHLASWDLLDFQLSRESKMEQSVAISNIQISNLCAKLLGLAKVLGNSLAIVK